MNEWEPATEAEVAMRDALRSHDQELYFRLLSRVELLLPVSPEALAGRTAVGWGTWTTDGRTHVLAFTSPEALYACLAEHGGTYRTLPFHDLAALWPNLEWWLAVNPGLPIEAYLPAWFVAQVSRGDVRLPGRTLGARARMEHATALRARATAQVPPRTVPSQPSGGSAPPERSPGPNTADLAPTALPQIPGIQPARAPVVIEGEVRVADPAPAERSPGLDGSGLDSAGLDSLGLNDRDLWSGDRYRVEPDQADRFGVSATPASAEPVNAYAPAPPLPVRPRPEPAPAEPEPAWSAASPLPVESPLSPTSPAASPDWAAPAEPEPAPYEPAPDDVPADEPVAEFTPANEVEENLLAAAEAGSTDTFLSTLLLARVLVPGPAAHEDAVEAIDRWRVDEIDGAPYVAVFTSPEMLAAHSGAGVDAVWLKFTQLIRVWPDEELSFAVNPGTPVGATLPGAQIVALASWAAEVGLTDDEPEDAGTPEAEPAPRTTPPPPSAGPVVMQKTISGVQLPYYLERGYDRVSGFVHRAAEVAHLRTPAEFYSALGLGYPDSPFKPDDSEVYVLRWTAHRGNLYRIPYGGPNEPAMHAMQGWVIERPPFRGNGFAPSEGRDVIAEFKVDSVRLPHGTQLWRVNADGTEKLIAMFDADGPRWQRVGDA